MLSIKILGPGCANCNRLDQLARQALERLGLEAEVVKLSDPAKFADYDVMTTPGLVINDETVCSGRVPSMSELSGFINAALAAG